MFLYRYKCSQLLHSFLLYFCSFTLLIQAQQFSGGQDVPDSCQVKSSETEVTYPGLPVVLNCYGLVENGVLTTSSYKCFFKSSDFQLQINQLLVHEYSSSSVTSYNASLVINETSCYSKLVTVERGNLTEKNPFNEIARDVRHDAKVVIREEHVAEKMMLSCSPPPPAGGGPQRRLFLPASATTTWWRTGRFKNGSLDRSKFVNFTEYIDGSHRVVTTKHKRQPDALKVHKTSRYFAGVYSCEVWYGNESAFVAHYSVCFLTPKNSNKTVIVTCNGNFTFSEGDDLPITCDVQTSTMRIKTNQMEVVWKKKGQNYTLCRNIFNKTVPEFFPQYTCSISKNFSNPEQKCFEYYESDHSLQNHFAERKTFTIQLKIKDIAEEDAGDYTVRVRYEQQWSEAKVITLLFNPENKLKRIIVILAIVLIALLTSVIVALVVWYNRISILLCYRRRFGKYEKDGKEYVATLSYFYSQELSHATRERTNKIVKCIRQKMEEMNYMFYDSHSDFDVGSSIENFLRYLDRSHCLIVVLSDAYVYEHCMRFQTSMGFYNMLKNRTKLIFIRTSGAKKAMSKCSKQGDQFMKELREAINRSKVIKWTDKMSDLQLKNHVEYALPNLKRYNQELRGRLLRTVD